MIESAACNPTGDVYSLSPTINYTGCEWESIIHPDFDPELEDIDLVREVFCYPTEIKKIPSHLDREEDLVRRNNTFFYDVG